MAQVELARAAVADLERFVRTHSLPRDTYERVRGSLRSLERFPLLGSQLSDRWDGFRFILGPWRWMLVVYVYDESCDRVVIVTIQDARTSSAAVASDHGADSTGERS